MANQIGWIRWLLGLVTLRQYQITWLPHDIVAGTVLATMLVPVGIAYAVASGVPGICGLYATIVPLLAYALFGPSRILVLGPDSSLAAVILGVVFPLSAGDSARAVALAGMMAVVSGVVCVLAGVAQLGFVTELLSKPIRYGYMNGIALTVLISQLPKFFGFSIEGSGPLRELWGHCQPGCRRQNELIADCVLDHGPPTNTVDLGPSKKGFQWLTTQSCTVSIVAHATKPDPPLADWVIEHWRWQGVC
jgi:MFS superfamily sulfate permease-like transporter